MKGSKSSMKTSPTKSTSTNRTPSGIVSAWGLWRHCMCRNGLYPLVVAPFVTISWFIDIYCTIGCDFMRIDIGFEPSNEAWSKETASLGLFSYQSGDSDNHSSVYFNNLHDGCKDYDSMFDAYFVSGDKTWMMSKLMGYIAGCSGCLATVTVWLMVITPIPVCFLWPGVLLPAVLVAFLSSGAKFLFFDTEICRSRVWLSDEDGSSPQIAETCTLSTDAIINIIGCALAFANILLVCLKAPKKRELEERFGFYDDDDKFEEGLRSGDTDLMEDSICETFTDDVENQIKSKEAKASVTEKETKKRNNHDVNSRSSPVYDMNKIHDEEREAMVENNRSQSYEMPGIPISQPNVRRSIGSKRKKVDWDSEKLRETEESVIHDERDISRDLSRSDMNIASQKVNSSLGNASMVSYKNDLSNSINYSREGTYESTMNNYVINKSFRKGLLSPCAPSDESSFITLSPGKQHMTQTNKTGSTPLVTLPSKKASSKKKLSSLPRASYSNSKTETPEKYNDELIKKCVVDLTKSFDMS